jgi:CDP-diacylglycerol--glycerol-3-phosphate 3-phosphatidyltransferase
MISRWVRTWDSAVLAPLLRLLARLGVTPNGLTVASWLLVLLAAILLARGYWVAGGLVLLAGGILDGLDGELARSLNAASNLGAFLDSITDHIGDLAVHLGLLWWYLARGAVLEPILLFVGLFASMLGSQIRSRAGMVGIDTKATGWATRFERLTILLVGLFTGWLTLALAVLAVINSLSAAQRLRQAVRAARKSPPP